MPNRLVVLELFDIFRGRTRRRIQSQCKQSVVVSLDYLLGPHQMYFNGNTPPTGRVRFSYHPLRSNHSCLFAPTDNMNLLQHLPASKHGLLLMTLNPPAEPASGTVSARFHYDHPVLNAAVSTPFPYAHLVKPQTRNASNAVASDSHHHRTSYCSVLMHFITFFDLPSISNFVRSCMYRPSHR